MTFASKQMCVKIKSRGQGIVINSFPITDKSARGESPMRADRKENFVIDLMSSLRANSRSDHTIQRDGSRSHYVCTNFSAHTRIDRDLMHV